MPVGFLFQNAMSEKTLSHKFKDEYAKVEMVSPYGRVFNARTITQGDIDRMPEKQKDKYLEAVKAEKPTSKTLNE